jgi:type I restriction enzyme, S subunit
MNQELIIKEKLPEGWNIYKLKDVVNLKSSGIQKFNGNKKYVSTGDLKEDSLSFIDVTFENRPSRANIEGVEGDLIFAKMKDTDKVLILTNELSDNIYSTGFYIITPNKEKILSNFLFYYLKSNFFKTQKNKLAKGATQKAINNNDFNKLWIIIPSLQIQKQIISKLNKQMIQIEIIKKWTNSLKNNINLISSSFIDSKIKKIKGKEILFEELVIEFRYGSSKKSNINKQGLPILRIPNVLNGNINKTDLVHINLTNQEIQKLFLKKGDILFVRTNGNPAYIGRCAVFNLEENKYVFASYLIRARINENIANPHFINILFKESYGRKQLLERATTSAGNFNINTESLKSIRLKLPSLQEQNKIVEEYNFIIEELNKIKIQYLYQSQSSLQLLSSLLNEVFGKYEVPEIN